MGLRQTFTNALFGWKPEQPPARRIRIVFPPSQFRRDDTLRIGAQAVEMPIAVARTSRPPASHSSVCRQGVHRVVARTTHEYVALSCQHVMCVPDAVEPVKRADAVAIVYEEIGPGYRVIVTGDETIQFVCPHRKAVRLHPIDDFDAVTVDDEQATVFRSAPGNHQNAI